nr:cubilin-like [Pocillopora verrucosa]
MEVTTTSSKLALEYNYILHFILTLTGGGDFVHFRVLLLQLIFEGNLEDQTGFISIGALYFINGYCSPEPEAAARRACRELFTDKTGVITSPYYPGYYANDSWCEWLVTAAFGHVIRLEFFYFQLEATGPQCLNDYVEVFDGNSTYSASLGRFCGHTHPAMLESSSNNLLVVFKSDNKEVRTGFKAIYDMRKDERDKCKMKPDCPVGCTCYITKGPPSQYVLEGADYMESIPWNLSSLTTVLLFAGCKITRLRNGDFYSLSSLIYIDLSHNKVFQMESRVFEGLTSLETLRLNNNFLRQLNDDVFGETTKLQYLDIGENLLVDLHEDIFDNLTDLRILSLRSNSIRQIKRDVFKRTTRLTHL